MYTDADLKPCPFCGGRVRWNFNIEFGINSIMCPGCKAMVQWRIPEREKDSMGEIMGRWMEKWNRRVPGGRK